jgi:phenylpropionate dioxygenase-like ring-hydroxylating dioxygenase large terminal subunit
MSLERTLSRDHYLSPELFASERERIFCREWFCVGREEELAAPGDYVVKDVAGESILVVRTKDGGLAGHYNVCRHRGSQLVPEGCAGSFGGAIRCPYHSWTYTLEGQLRTAPFLDLPPGSEADSDGQTLSKGELSLHPVGVECWGGFVFVHLTPLEAKARGQTLASELGAVAERLRRYPLRELRAARRIVYEIQANWKVMLENYNECYHCGPVHPELCRLVPAFKQGGGSDLDWERGIPHRDGAWTFTATGTTTRAPFDDLDDDERIRHKGELIYPNLLLSLSAEHVAAFLVFPHGPDRTTIVNDFLFHPAEMAKPGFDPSDAVDFWDLVNRQDWRICESVQRGMTSRVFQSGYYAPMESASLDIRRYVGERLGRDKS